MGLDLVSFPVDVGELNKQLANRTTMFTRNRERFAKSARRATFSVAVSTILATGFVALANYSDAFGALSVVAIFLTTSASALQIWQSNANKSMVFYSEG